MAKEYTISFRDGDEEYFNTKSQLKGYIKENKIYEGKIDQVYSKTYDAYGNEKNVDVLYDKRLGQDKIKFYQPTKKEKLKMLESETRAQEERDNPIGLGYD